MRRHVRYKTFDQLSFADMLIYNKLPHHPFWSQLETNIDFSFADELCAVLYSGRGQRPFAPSLKLKVHLIQVYYNLSDRQVEEKIVGDLFIKRFLGLPADFFGFDHSTIGLDRTRLGDPMFHACHLMVLAQMHQLGLWGDREEHWILDSFPANAGVAIVSSYRLIQQCMIRLVQHLKKNHSSLYQWVCQTLMLDAMTYRLPLSASPDDRMRAFSKLVAQAHALLYGLESTHVAPFAAAWKSEQARKQSLQLQAIVKQVLTENSKPLPPDDPGATPKPSSHAKEMAGSSTTSPEAFIETGEGAMTEPITYTCIPRQDRPANRIISAHDPEARRSAKGRQLLKSYKVQTLCTNHGVILNTMAIPASEADGVAMFHMTRDIQAFFRLTPKVMVGDTAYGYGRQRMELASLNIPVVAPAKPPSQKEGLYPLTSFVYDEQNDVYRCPSGSNSVRKQYSPAQEGSQYRFDKAVCEVCSLREQCTSSSYGRSVFRSQYANLYDNAKTFNASDEGRYLLRSRMTVERKNKELKIDCGLGAPNTRSRTGVNIKSKLSAIIVNLKYVVRRLGAPKSKSLCRAS